MTPDEMHKEYYKENPIGNHLSPSPETIRFMEKQEKINDKLLTELNGISIHLAKQDQKLEDGFKTLNNKLDSNNETVKNNNSWINENCEFIKNLKEGTKETKSKLRGLFWDLIKMGVVSALTVLGAVFFGKK